MLKTYLLLIAITGPQGTTAWTPVIEFPTQATCSDWAETLEPMAISWKCEVGSLAEQIASKEN